MKRWKIPLGLVISLLLIIVLLSIPMKQAITFTEARTEDPMIAYQFIGEDMEFQIRYVHSIFLTDVLESYRIQPDNSLKFLTMRYEDVGIGLPAYAEVGETLELSNNGIYTLTYEDRVIESFILYIGDVDAELALRYEGDEINLKSILRRGKSYEFSIKKLTLIEILKGVNLNGKTK